MMMRTLCHLYSKPAPREFSNTHSSSKLSMLIFSLGASVSRLPLKAIHFFTFPSLLLSQSGQPLFCTLFHGLCVQLDHYLFSALTFLTRKLSHVSSSLCCSRDNILDSVAWCTRLLAEPCSPLALLSCPVILTSAPCTTDIQISSLHS